VGGVRLEPIGRSRLFDFVSADSRFFGAFSDLAGSGLPIQISKFTAGRFVDVTRLYPALITKDARQWWHWFTRSPSDGNGYIAAWAADEELLGHGALVNDRLALELRRGRLGAALPGGWGGRRFTRRLNTLLRRWGYLRS
jgi:hypothetical protein